MELIENVLEILTGKSCKKVRMNLSCNYELTEGSEFCRHCQAQQIDELYQDHFASQTPEGLLLMVDETESVLRDLLYQYLELLKARDDYSSAIIIEELLPRIMEHLQAQLAKLQPYLQAQVEQARKETAREFSQVSDKMMEALSFADFSNGIDGHGTDEGRVRGYELLKAIDKEYKSLKEKYLKE